MVQDQSSPLTRLLVAITPTWVLPRSMRVILTTTQWAHLSPVPLQDLAAGIHTWVVLRSMQGTHIIRRPSLLVIRTNRLLTTCMASPRPPQLPTWATTSTWTRLRSRRVKPITQLPRMWATPTMRQLATVQEAPCQVQQAPQDLSEIPMHKNTRARLQPLRLARTYQGMA